MTMKPELRKSLAHPGMWYLKMPKYPSYSYAYVSSWKDGIDLFEEIRRIWVKERWRYQH